MVPKCYNPSQFLSIRIPLSVSLNFMTFSDVTLKIELVTDVYKRVTLC